MPGPREYTPDQISDFLSEHYGSARVNPPNKDGSVCVTGMRDEVDVCRIILSDRGYIIGAWDPDSILNAFREQYK